MSTAAKTQTRQLPRSVTVYTAEHPHGSLLWIECNTGALVLSRDEALELYELLQLHLGGMASPQQGASHDLL